MSQPMPDSNTAALNAWEIKQDQLERNSDALEKARQSLIDDMTLLLETELTRPGQLSAVAADAREILVDSFRSSDEFDHIFILALIPGSQLALESIHGLSQKYLREYVEGNFSKLSKHFCLCL